MPLIATTGDLITFVLRASGINGIGQTPMAEDSNTGLQLLHSMVAQWQKKRWLVYVETEVAVESSTGAQWYSIGPGCDFDTPSRPDHITAAYIRIMPGSPPNLVDIPLEILHSREDYAAIAVKTLETMPYYLFYETGWPTGKVYVWPIPPANQYGIYLTIKSPLPTYTTLTDELNVPPEYIEAMMWSLCLRMQMAYGLPARNDHAAAAEVALNTIRQANTQIPQLQLPTSLGRWRGGAGLVGQGLGRAFVLNTDVVLG